ncbi:putative ATPase N2B [Trichonephila clavipes]|nr:putative ATPase N2B [Trichonephila clavipes]
MTDQVFPTKILIKPKKVTEVIVGFDVNKLLPTASESNAKRELDEAFKVLASQENDVVRPKTLTIKNRNVKLQKTCGRVADCTFVELCDRPLGAIDYLMISQVFNVIIIRDIPQMTRRQKSQARRFITLIDTLYDNKSLTVRPLTPKNSALEDNLCRYLYL